MAAPPPAGMEDVKLTLRGLPQDMGEYSRWRFAMKAAVLAACNDPLLGVTYLAELDADDTVVGFADLPLLVPPQLLRTDMRLFAAVVQACKGQTSSKYVEQIEARATFGCGRQAIRILDHAFKNEAGNLAMRAHREIIGLQCPSIDHLESYVSRFVLLCAQMTAGRVMPDAVAVQLINQQLGHLKELDEVFANFQVQVRLASVTSGDLL